MNTKQNKTPKCRLCKHNDASSIGSHIFNRELINWTLNEEGEENNPDKESAFTISLGKATESYFGRKVSLGTIEETLGREMTDEEIEANKSAYTHIVKYFLCVDCEKRLERIERYSMTNVYNKIQTKASEEVLEDLSISRYDDVNKEIVKLYFYSLFWRGMESKISYCDVEEWQKETLRKILDEILDVDISITIQNCSQRKDEINQYPLIIYYLTTTKEPSRNYVYIDPKKAPYFYLIGDISIQIFFETQTVKCHERKLFGLSKFKKIKKLVNRGNRPLRIGIVSEAFRTKVVLEKIIRISINQEVKEMLKHVSEAYTKFFPLGKPSKGEIKRIAYQILAESNDPSLPRIVRNSPQKKMEIFMGKFIEIAEKKKHPIGL